MAPGTGSQASAEAVQTRSELARELTVLRARSGLTVRELASRLNVPAATLGGYFSGRHLPGPAYMGLYRSMLEECGVPGSQLGAWVDALARARLSSDGRVARAAAPYLGLEAFQAEDAGLFYGREAATAEVLEQLAGLCASPGMKSPLLIVVGPSGSGKSSLLRAGVVPAVLGGALGGTARRWEAEVVTPASITPAALGDCISRPPGTSLLLVVDQLEEVFRLPPELRGSFLERVASLEPSRGAVVGALRADFYEAATMEPALLAGLRHNQVLLGPMTAAELRDAIVLPAQHAGVSVDEGLVELLLADLAPRSPTGFAHDAGALPFLSYALLATWERARRNQLTVADYLAAGGLRGAIRQSAEELFADLDATDQDLARRTLCRLVNVEHDAPLTRRRMTGRELEQLGAGASEVLGRFVAARLVTADATGAEVSHEALLYAWPRLAGWLEADRAGLRLHHQLRDDAAAWARAGKDPSLLQRGTRLAVTSEWAGGSAHGEDLNADEREFLEASQSLRASELATARRRARRTKQLLALVTALAVVASVLAGIALEARSSAARARDEALSRQVAIEAGQLEPADPALADQLALAAYRISPTVQARSALLDASASEMPARILGPSGPTFLAVGQDGRMLAVAQSATDDVKLYSLAPGGRPALLATVQVASSSASTFTVALSPDGRLLAAGGTNGSVALYLLTKPGRPVRLATLGGFTSTVYDVAFDPRGQSLAAVSNDGSARVWDLSRPGRPFLEGVVRAPRGAPLQAVAYNADGSLLAAAGADGTLLVWRPGQDKAQVVAGAGAAQLTCLAFSPDGRLLATGGEDNVVRLFSVAASGAARTFRAPLAGFSSWVDSIAFSPDGGELVAGSSDNSLREWSTSNWASLDVLEHPAPVTGAAFLPSGATLVTADADGTVRLWPMPPPSTYVTSGPVFAIDYTADGHMLAAVSGGPDGEVALWDTAAPLRPVHINDVTTPASFGPVAGVGALGPDGHLLAVGNASALIELVNLSDLSRPKLLGAPLKGATPPLEQLVLNPAGTVLASGDNSGRVHLWDVSDPARPRALPVLAANGYIVGVAFSPNGRLLAAASTDDKVWLWGISNPAHPKLLAVLGGFANYAECVVFTPDGRTLIAGSADDTVRLWDVSDPAKPKALGGPLSGPTSYVYSLSVSPDGRALAASTIDQAVWLWDISAPAHPHLLADLTAASGQVDDVTFSPDGHTLVAGGSDQLLTFWDYRPADVAARICSAAISPLTRAEWGEYVQGAPYSPPCR